MQETEIPNLMTGIRTDEVPAPIQQTDLTCAESHLLSALQHLRLASEKERFPRVTTTLTDAERYAEGLAVALAKKVNCSPEWRPLSGDLIGLLTQIDNASTGLWAAAYAQGESDMRKKAATKATSFLVGDLMNGIPLRSPSPHEIAKAIQAIPLSQPNAPDTREAALVHLAKLGQEFDAAQGE